MSRAASFEWTNIVSVFAFSFSVRPAWLALESVSGKTDERTGFVVSPSIFESFSALYLGSFLFFTASFVSCVISSVVWVGGGYFPFASASRGIEPSSALLKEFHFVLFGCGSGYSLKMRSVFFTFLVSLNITAGAVSQYS